MILRFDDSGVEIGRRIDFDEFPKLVIEHLRRCSGTADCEELGADLYANLNAGSATGDEVWYFIVAVCTWGGKTGNRVRGKVAVAYDSAFTLERFGAAAATLRPSNATTATSLLQADLQVAAQAIDDIPGLATSYATKMVRFLRPDIAGVLDRVISAAGGYPLDNGSYGPYCTDCLAIARHLHAAGVVNPRTGATTWRAGDVDQALFARCQGWA